MNVWQPNSPLGGLPFIKNASSNVNPAMIEQGEIEILL